ncbi:LysM peptidoglycan-binding domain-containing protein [Pontibacter sp. 13R65]|uniref:LysM peptidoglycan-binding domain-containing protein n=1 Tax=Pontibacter sp. 13R65 TaxID=3127458 RepID=UPI00301D8232
MRKNLPLLLLMLLMLPVLALAQAVIVPKNVTVADIQIRISDRAQQEIQKKVDALHRNQTYFRNRVELADAYFPWIERTFKEEGVPDDFKYLALQESGLIGDAVSTSNAVGYWQFKKEAASDFNLRMDHIIDERRHIIEASRGAAKYFKRSNTYYNNWFNTILSYYLGPTGAKAATKTSDIGSKRMEVTEKTHTYLLTYLAHKIAYENFVGKTTSPTLMLSEMRCTPGQSLLDIALATKIDAGELEKYNKWLLGGTIPSDKDYYVMIPMRSGQDPTLLASKGPVARTGNLAGYATTTSITKLHGLNALVARRGDTKEKLAKQNNISLRKFQKYNDLYSFDEVKEGGIYYLEQKKTSADVAQHVVQPGETMHMISQHYGIQLSHLVFNNRMDRSETPVAGRVLWLQKRRPARTPVEVRDLNKSAVAAAPAPIASAKQAPVKQTSAPQKQAPQQEEPKGNFFTRLINSLKGKKNEPEPVPMEEPVDEPEEEQKETELVETELDEQESTSPAPAAKVKNEAIYPGSQSQKATTTATTPAKQTETPAATQPVGTITPATVAKTKVVADTVLFERGVSWESEPGATTKPQPKPVETHLPPPAQEPQPKPVQEITIEPLDEEPLKEQEVEQQESTVVEQGDLPADNPVAAPAVAPAQHTVKQGETLYSISRAYAVSINDISNWNDLGETPIKVGQVLLIAEPQVIPAEEPGAAAPATQPVHTHTVVAGETLYQISKKYGISVDELKAWNNLTATGLSIGQELQVTAPAEVVEEAPVENKPSGTAGGNQSKYHTVATGESLYQISRKHDITIKEIMEWNNKSDFSVKVGEKLLIRKK